MHKIKNMNPKRIAWMKEPLGQTVVRKVRAWWNKPLIYPWPEELNEEVASAESLRVCHHCFAEQDHLGWFCQECGTATGPYNNTMPFVYIFSIGEVVRAGVRPEVKRSRLVGLGYLLFSLAEYFLFFPFYWYRYLTRKKRAAGLEKPTLVYS